MLHRRFALAFALVLPSVPTFAASPLADQPSAFLRAHADSPVQWMTWGDAAFARAKAENKPVFVVIGAFTSELSRAMRTQSFAREENAALLNDNFVCVLVDRDDQPDLAALAQHYVNVVKQTQGWPINLWLTPELKPFEGATYLPPSDEWGKEGFANATKRVLAAWQADPAAQRTKADEAVAAQIAAAPPAPAAVDTAAIKQLLADSAAGWTATVDLTNGGFGEPPKYPQPELLRFLLGTEDEAQVLALSTFSHVVAGAVSDPLDGGIFRYASDAEWNLPYLQKTLLDQARLALGFFAVARSKGPLFEHAARRALDYALSLGDATRGFAAAEDGTREDLAPSFFWTTKEIKGALGDDAAALAVFGATEAGNLAADAYLGVETTGKNIPRLASPEHTATTAKLLAVRRTRPAPLRDDIATAGAHGLLLAALARAGAELPEPRFAAAAKELAAFIRDQLRASDGALRCRPGRTLLASPRDHALVIDGLLAYHAVSGDNAARELALDLLAKLNSMFGDSATGRFFAAPEKLPPGLWARVHVPAPDNADLPGAEPALLLALVSHQIGDEARRTALAAAIAQEMNDSPNLARGDQLLALQVYIQNR